MTDKRGDEMEIDGVLHHFSGDPDVGWIPYDDRALSLALRVWKCHAKTWQEKAQTYKKRLDKIKQIVE